MTQADSRGNILLVDDDTIVLKTLGVGLRKANYCVSECSTARDAVNQYTASTPDLAILDIGLPDMRGTALAGLLLEHCYRPILILSSRSEQDCVEQAIGFGVSGYLVKPLTTEQLLPSIETALARFDEINHQVEKTIGNSAMPTTQLLAALDQLAFGVAIINDTYEVMHANRIAHKLMGERNLLTEPDRQGRVSVNNNTLVGLLDQSLGKTNGAAAPAALSLRGAVPDQMLHCLGVPSPASGEDDRQTAILIVNNPSLNAIAPSSVMKSLFGFTEKESKLAHALASGQTLNQYCEIACVSVNTARTHLKSIYRKTSTNRQAELISLISHLFISLPELQD